MSSESPEAPDSADDPGSGDDPGVGDDNVVPLKPRKCPQCSKPVVHEFRPFCSRRCAKLDLGSWLDESYRVPVDDPGAMDDGEDVIRDED